MNWGDWGNVFNGERDRGWDDIKGKRLAGDPMRGKMGKVLIESASLHQREKKL